MVRAPAVTEPPVALAGGEKPRRGRKRHLPIYKQCLYPLAYARYFPQRGKSAYGFPYFTPPFVSGINPPTFPPLNAPH